MRLKRKLFIFLTIFVFSTLLNVTALSGTQAVNNEPEPFSTGKLLKLSAVSTFTPGIGLLMIAEDVKKERNTRGENNWFVNLTWLWWIIAFGDFITEKIPMAAHVHQFLQYGIIWYIAYIASTIFGADSSMVLGALTGSGVQLARQAYHLGTGLPTAGVASGIISLIEDVVAGYATYSIL